MRILNLVNSVELHTQQVYQEALALSDGLKECMENSPNKPPFSINYLEYYNSYEPVTSWIVRHIFAYQYNGCHPFFESFAKTFLQRIGFCMDWIDAPIIDKDHEYKSIDILVRDKQYAVIIENKLKGAEFQLNQLARYIATMRNEGYSDEQIFVVVLPKDNIDNDDLHDSVWKLPQDWQSTTASRKCRINDHTCWCDNLDYQQRVHCAKCESLKKLYENRTIFIHKELSGWLYDCISNNTVGLSDEEYAKQYVLKSAALQFVDFLNSLYKTRENDKYKMDIQKFLSEQLNLDNHSTIEQLSLVENKIDDTLKLSEELNQLFKKRVRTFISEIGSKYQVHIECDEKNPYDYYHCELAICKKKFDVRLSYDKDGFFCSMETIGRAKIPDFIKNNFDISEELNDPNNNTECIWRYDTYKESLLRFDRVLGLLLDIQKNN